MAIKVAVTLECSECGDKVPIKGKKFTRYSRRRGSSSGIYLPDVYVVKDPEEYDDYNSMSIQRGFSFFGSDEFSDDDEGLVCSLSCAKTRASALIGKLKPEKFEKVEEC